MSSPAILATPSRITALVPTSLTLSAAEGARVMALHWLYELMAARIAWGECVGGDVPVSDDDAESVDSRALHRFRVALRRLRLTLREHRRLLDLKDYDVYQRSLRRLNGFSDALRDRDVRASWLHANAASLSPDAREQAVASQRRADEACTMRDRRRLSRACARHFDAHALHLARALSQYDAHHVVGEDHHARQFAQCVADRLAEGSQRVERALSQCGTAGSEQQFHRLRMQFKRLRALLAPYVGESHAVRRYFAFLTQGQDALGAMRDATLFATLAERDTLTELSSALRTAAQNELALFDRLWNGPAEARTVMRDAARTALLYGYGATDHDILGAAADDTPESEPPTDNPSRPEGFDAAALARSYALPMEIERKFLLHGLPPRAAIAPAIRIEQGWLPGALLRERLRQSTSTSGEVQRTRTIKLGQPGARIEVEEPVATELFDAMWPLTVGARIHKRRHVVADGVLTWEVDVFLDRDLVLAEVELRDTAQAVDIPRWLAPFVVKEVTDDPAYLNAVMARGAADDADGDHP